MRSIRLFLLLFCGTTLAFAGENEFRGVVHAIEAHYGVHHSHIPFLGFALFFVRPEGVSGFKLAVFENFPGPAEPGDVSRLVENCLGPGWYPFVRVRSNSKSGGNAASDANDADSETTLIYANPSRGKLRMMIVSVESSETTVVELKLGERAIRQWLKEPGEEAEAQSGRRRQHTQD